MFKVKFRLKVEFLKGVSFVFPLNIVEPDCLLKFHAIGESSGISKLENFQEIFFHRIFSISQVLMSKEFQHSDIVKARKSRDDLTCEWKVKSSHIS